MPRRMLLTFVFLGLSLPSVSAATTDDEFSHRAKWTEPNYAQTRRRMLAIIDAAESSVSSKDLARRQWPATEPAGGPAPFQRAIDTAALIYPAAEELVEFCEAPRDVQRLPTFSILQSETVPPMIRSNLRLLYGRWLARERLYDEAHEQLAGMSANDVLDPASLLFYQGVVFHRLLRKEEALAALEQLLSAGDNVPRRYRNVAALMKADIEPLEDESLDHIARRMHDVRRRLELGRAGKKVQIGRASCRERV